MLRQKHQALRDDNFDLAERVEWRDSVVKDAEAHNMTPLDLAQDYAKEKGRSVVDIITNVLMCKGQITEVHYFCSFVQMFVGDPVHVMQ